jgi:hypothetical protein
MSENNIKKLDFYKNGKIYRIVCNQTGLQYIGSTCKTLKQRLQQHKTSYKCYNGGKGNYITSFKIIEKNDYVIVLIEDFPCDRKEQLNARERFYVESMTCVNKNSPNKLIELGQVEYSKQYNKEYYNENKDKISEQQKDYYNENKDKILDYQKDYRNENKNKILDYQKDYRNENKDKILEQQKQYYNDNKAELLDKGKEKLPCSHCGCTYTRYNESHHKKSKKHQQNSSDTDTTISDITI